MQIVSNSNSSSTSASVLMINAQGIMLSVLGRDYFLSYNRIPWMQDAPIRSVLNVQMSSPEAIEWPDLDVDLEVESLQHPERYPLVIKRNALDFAGVEIDCIRGRFSDPKRRSKNRPMIILTECGIIPWGTLKNKKY